MVPVEIVMSSFGIKSRNELKDFIRTRSNTMNKDFVRFSEKGFLFQYSKLGFYHSRDYQYMITFSNGSSIIF